MRIIAVFSVKDRNKLLDKNNNEVGLKITDKLNKLKLKKKKKHKKKFNLSNWVNRKIARDPFQKNENKPQAKFIERRCDNDVLQKLFKSTIRGLCFLESKKLLHLDIKPKNILFLEKEELVFQYCDFGEMKRQKEFDLKDEGNKTIDYLDPIIIENIIRQRKTTMDCRADLWSLGCSLVEFIARKTVKRVFYDKTKEIDEETRDFRTVLTKDPALLCVIYLSEVRNKIDPRF